jgi:hypothetical protein
MNNEQISSVFILAESELPHGNFGKIGSSHDRSRHRDLAGTARELAAGLCPAFAE